MYKWIQGVGRSVRLSLSSSDPPSPAAAPSASACNSNTTVSSSCGVPSAAPSWEGVGVEAAAPAQPAVQQAPPGSHCEGGPAHSPNAARERGDGLPEDIPGAARPSTCAASTLLVSEVGVVSPARLDAPALGRVHGRSAAPTEGPSSRTTSLEPFALEHSAFSSSILARFRAVYGSTKQRAPAARASRPWKPVPNDPLGADTAHRGWHRLSLYVIGLTSELILWTGIEVNVLRLRGTGRNRKLRRPI